MKKAKMKWKSKNHSLQANNQQQASMRIIELYLSIFLMIKYIFNVSCQRKCRWITSGEKGKRNRERGMNQLIWLVAFLLFLFPSFCYVSCRVLPIFFAFSKLSHFQYWTVYTCSVAVRFSDLLACILKKVVDVCGHIHHKQQVMQVYWHSGAHGTCRTFHEPLQSSK